MTRTRAWLRPRAGPGPGHWHSGWPLQPQTVTATVTVPSLAGSVVNSVSSQPEAAHRVSQATEPHWHGEPERWPAARAAASQCPQSLTRRLAAAAAASVRVWRVTQSVQGPPAQERRPELQTRPLSPGPGPAGSLRLARPPVPMLPPPTVTVTRQRPARVTVNELRRGRVSEFKMQMQSF